MTTARHPVPARLAGVSGSRPRISPVDVIAPEPPEPAAEPARPTSSAAPRRETGTRTRAGNAMARTRAALLAGALSAVARHGTRRTTMNDIATAGGVAKATLYNHFRTKEDVWAALVESEVTRVAVECGAQDPARDLVDALAQAALALSQHPVLRRLAQDEPEVLARLALPGLRSAGWQVARQAVRDALAARGLDGDDVILRWLASHLFDPATPARARHGAQVLVKGLAVPRPLF
jgi:AcrR family transcriptional regulator